MRFFWMSVVLGTAAACVGWSALLAWCLSESGTLDAYGAAARTPIFSGCLTLGSFMLTLKTTMLGRLKEAYDSDMHKMRWLNAYCVEEARAKHNDCAPNHLGYYQGLRNISQALGATIIMAFGTAILQMTLGFVTHPVAIGICAGAATGTVGLLIFLCVQMLLAHVEWFDILEADKRDKILAESREHEEKMTQHSEMPASPTGTAQSVGKPKTSTKAPKGHAPQKPSSE